jgi:hypothetical protein
VGAAVVLTGVTIAHRAASATRVVVPSTTDLRSVSASDPDAP